MENKTTITTKTILEDFLEKHPNAELDENGVPVTCPLPLGYNPSNSVRCGTPLGLCSLCWNSPLVDGTNQK